MDRSQSKQHLLIADANPQNVNVLKTILTPDYDISVAADAKETIRLASSPDPPGLILLNDMLPAADLSEVFKQLKSQQAHQGYPGYPPWGADHRRHGSKGL